MNKVVTHFTRKYSQLGAPFINHQILNHLSYQPNVVCRYGSKQSGVGFAQFNETDVPLLNLSKNQRCDINFYYLKRIRPDDIRKVLQFLEDVKTKVLHLHFGSDAYIYSDIMSKSNLPSVVSFYGYDIGSVPKKFFGLGANLLHQGAFKYASKILAMSPDMKEDLIKAGCPQQKVLVHYYGVRTDLFKRIVINYDVKPVIRLLIFASLVPQKGHIFLLNAVQRLLGWGINNFTLDIIGSGSLENELKSFCDKKNLGGHVKFLGSAKFASEKIISGLMSADIFIHPSVIAPNGDKEGIPGTIVEAMASGLPVISTYHAGIPYIIENEKTGLLVNEWDVDALATAIKRLMEDHLLRKKLGEAAKAYACEHLDLMKKEQELEAIYDSLL